MSLSSCLPRLEFEWRMVFGGKGGHKPKFVDRKVLPDNRHYGNGPRHPSCMRPYG